MTTTAVGTYLEKLVNFGEYRGKHLAVLFLVVFVLLALARFSVFTIWQEHTFDASEITPVTGYAYITGYHYPFSDQASAGEQLKLFEDGKDIGPGRSHPNIVSSQGGGTYLTHKNFIVFSASDNSDPRSNKKSYKIRYPFSPSDFLLLFSGMICLLMNFPRSSRTLQFISATHPVTLLAVLVVTAFLFRLYITINYWDEQIFGHYIKGMPFSDAAMWFNLGINYELGYDLYTSALQWDGRRQGYAWFLSAVFNIFGESVNGVRFIHIVLGAASTGLAFDILRRLLPTPLAVVITLSVAIHTYDAFLLLTSLSEPLGYFLNNLALWFLFQGITKNRKPENNTNPNIHFILAGLIFAYSNLVRPLTLGAMIPVALFIAWYLYDKNNNLKENVNGAIKPAVIFTIGLLIVISPWLVRQQVTHNFFSITDNTVEMLYAATNPKFGTWSYDVGKQAEKENPDIINNISKRHQFYKNGVKTNLAGNLGWYIKNSLFYAYQQLLSLTPQKWVIVLCVAIFILTFTPYNDIKNKLTLLLFVFIIILALLPSSVYSYFALVILLAGSGVAILKRQPIGFLALVFVITALSLGAMGTTTDPRFNYSLNWIATSISVWFLWNLMHFIKEKNFRLYESNSNISLPTHRLEKPIKYFALVAATLFVFGNLVTVYAQFYPKPFISSNVEDTTANHIIADFLTTNAESIIKPSASNLRVFKSRLRPGFSVTFEANESIRHWSGIFSPRNYAYTMFYTMPPIEGDRGIDLAAVAPGKIVLDDNNDYYLIGVINKRRYAGTFELVGMARVDPKDGGLKWISIDNQSTDFHIRHINKLMSQMQ